MSVILNDSPAYRPSPATNTRAPKPPIDSRTRPATPASAAPVSNAAPYAGMSLLQQRDAAEAGVLAAKLDASGRFLREGLTFGDFAKLSLRRLRELEAGTVTGNAADEFAGYDLNACLR
ncbi:MAG TPA: hypothetical protein PKC97_11590 [Burkholderiaceae bacterium]|nr:hypothetical protein [Burkholderiaceae bacterium]